MELTAEARTRLLERWPLAALATLAPGGGPHLVPIVFAWHAEHLWSPIDGKPKREGELARLRHLRRDPRVCVLLDGWDADWSRLWWIRIDGRAQIVEAVAPERDPALAPIVAALRAKYPQYAETPLFRGTPTLLCVAPEALRSWCAGPAGPR